MTHDRSPEARTLVPDAWQSALVLSLRMRDASGARIGEAIAEVEQFCVDSGMTAQDAFGAPDEYAARLSEATESTSGGTKTSDVRAALSRAIALLGFVLVLAAVPAATSGAESVTITLGWLLAVPAILGATVLVVRAAVDDAVRTAQDKADGIRRRRWGLWAVTATAFLVVGALVILLTQPVLELPTWLALTLGAVLSIGDGVLGTLSELREPTADLVVDPRESSGDTQADAERRRRTAVRSGVLTAWIVPAFAVVGAVMMVALEAVS